MSAHRVVGLLKEYWFLAGVTFAAFWFLTTVLFSGLWFKYGDFVVNQARDALGITALAEQVARATGEDRVIRQPEGLSYIKEPVSVGENVVMIMVAERTTLGRDCRLTEWIPIFTDERNIPTPGSRAVSGQVRRQIGDDLVTLRIEMIPPELRPGRVTVYLTLDYDCGGKMVPDRTRVLAFELMKD